MSIAHIPHKNDIITHLKNGNGKTCAPLITSLGKLLLITGERHTQRASIPTNMWIRAWFGDDIERAKAAKIDETGKYAAANLAWNPDEVAKMIDFSGDGLWRTYQKASELEWETMGSWSSENISLPARHCVPVSSSFYNKNMSCISHHMCASTPRA
ncbi:hypothetical protein R5R35_006981 [Gryllus longicercus]|uniref:Uncharacterized protein n=1 Tax=Gryllus longicercus TaxID=2509291 RepID=A0AAN9ZF76_9ORTH